MRTLRCLPNISRTAAPLIAACLLGLLGSSAQAQTVTYTWNGGGGANWSDNNNWTGGAPLSDLVNTLVVLDTSNNLTNTLNYNFSANSLTFASTAGAFIVSGSNTITLGTGGLTVAAGNANAETFNANLTIGAAQAWTNSGTSTLTIGGVVTITTFNLGLAGTGNISFASGGSVSLGSGGITNTNTGTVTLAGPITLTAGSAITNNAASGTFSISGNISVGANTLTVGGSGNTTISGVVGFDLGTGGLTMSGTGTVALSAPNTFSGIVTISNGILSIAAPASLGTNATAAALTLNGGTLQTTGAAAVTFASGQGTTVTASSFLNAGATAPLTLSDVSIGAFTLTSNGAGAVTLSAGGTLGTTTLTGNAAFTNAGSGLFTLAAPIAAGGNSLSVGTTSTGNLLVSGTITYAGGNTLNSSTTSSGTVNISGAINFASGTAATIAASGTGAGTTTISAATLTLPSGSTTPLTITNNNNAALLTVSSAISNAGNLITVNGTGNTTLSGVIGNGTGGVTMSGTGSSVLTLSALNNTFSGIVTINSGTVSILDPTNLGVNNTAAMVTLAGGTLSASTTVSLPGSTGITITAGGSALNSATAGQTFTIAAVTPGSNSFSLTGPGNTTITGGLTFTGGTPTITANTTGTGAATIGAVDLSATTGLTFANTGTGLFTIGGTVTAAGNPITFSGGGAGNISVTGAVNFTGPSSITNTMSAGAPTISGLITLGGATAFTNNAGTALTISTGGIAAGGFGLTFNGTGVGTNNVTGPITGFTSVTSSASGPVTLSGAITASGAVTIANNASPLLTIGAGAFNAGANTILFNGSGGGNTTVSGTITFSGASSITNSVTGTGATTLTALVLGGTTAITNNSATLLTIIGGISGTATNLSFSGAGNFHVGNNANNIAITSGSVTMSGSGTLQLDTTGSTYTGGFNINNAAAIVIANSTSSMGISGQTTFNAAGTLDLQRDTAGTFTTGLNTTVSGGTVLSEQRTLSTGITQTLSQANTLGTNTVNVGPGANVTSGAYGLTLSGATTLSGNPTFNVNSANFLGTLSVTGGFNTSGVTSTLTVNGAGSALIISGAFSGTAGILDLAGNVPTITINALTTSANAVRVSGTGTYTFAGASTFTGGVILNNASATVIGTVAGAFGTVAGQVTFNVPGTTLTLRAAATSFTTGLNASANGGTIVVDPAVVGAGVTQTLTGVNTFGTQIITVQPGANTTSGPYGLTFSGSSTLSGGNTTFNLSNNFANTLTTSGGFNTGGVTSTLTVNGSASTWVVSGAFSGTAGILNLAGNVPTITINALTTSANAVEVSGTGTYTFQGAGTFTGGVILNNASATVIGTVAGAFGTAAGQVTFNVPGTTLTLRAAATSFTTGLNASANGGTVVVDPAVVGAGVTQTLTGVNTFGTQIITVQPGANTTSGPYGLTFSGSSTLSGGNTTFNLSNSFANTLTTSGGFNTGGVTSTLTVNGSASTWVVSGAFSGTAGILNLAGNVPTITINALTTSANAVEVSGTGTYTFQGAGTFTGGVILNNASATVIGTVAAAFGTVAGQVTFNVPGTTLTLRAAATSFTTGLNASTNGGTVVVDPAVVGAGVTQTLTGVNTFGTQIITVQPGANTTSGPYGLTFSGSSTLSGGNTTFNMSNSFANTLTMSGGFNTGGATSTLTVNGSASTWVISGAFSGTAGILDLAGNVPTITVNALTTSANTVRASGTGTYTFAGAGTFTGGVIVNNASAIVIGTVAASFGAAPGQVTFNQPGTLDLRAAATTYTTGLNTGATGGTILIDPAAQGAGVTHKFSGANTLGSETIKLGAGSLTNVNSAFGLNLTGTSTVSGNPNFYVNTNGTSVGTLTLSGAVNVTGVSNITDSGPGVFTITLVTLNMGPQRGYHLYQQQLQRLHP